VKTLLEVGIGGRNKKARLLGDGQFYYYHGFLLDKDYVVALSSVLQLFWLDCLVYLLSDVWPAAKLVDLFKREGVFNPSPVSINASEGKYAEAFGPKKLQSRA
jgi:hypothetical protein